MGTSEGKWHVLLDEKWHVILGRSGGSAAALLPSVAAIAFWLQAEEGAASQAGCANGLALQAMGASRAPHPILPLARGAVQVLEGGRHTCGAGKLTLNLARRQPRKTALALDETVERQTLPPCTPHAPSQRSGRWWAAWGPAQTVPASGPCNSRTTASGCSPVAAWCAAS